MLRDETTYYLEMTSPADLRPSTRRADARIERVLRPIPELNRFFYSAIGGDWYWIDRLSWTYARWMDYLTQPHLETWVGYADGAPFGYFELDGPPGGDIELAYFGVLPQFIGQGLGGRLLTAAVQRMWEKGAARVWVHTCNFDHPQALANYQARGFRLYHQETKPKEVPPASPGPWPGAERTCPIASMLPASDSLRLSAD